MGGASRILQLQVCRPVVNDHTSWLLPEGALTQSTQNFISHWDPNDDDDPVRSYYLNHRWITLLTFTFSSMQVCYC